MLKRNRTLTATIVAAAMLLGWLALPATSAMAAPEWNHVCQGTLKKPGHAPSLSLNLVVRGVCFVDRGTATVVASVTVEPRATLVAAFGLHHSRLNVSGNIFVRKGGTLLLGCDPAEFACIDDPHPKHPTLRSRSFVGGSLIATAALGVVVHVATIGHNVSQSGGGGGLTCKPKGPFAAFKSPVYTAYESSQVGGRLAVRHLHSCWLGVINNRIGETATVSSNLMADPDANEVVSNVVLRDLVCWRNQPKVQYGDSHGKPNRVGRHALFQCGFRRLVPDPAGQAKHLEHISVRLH